MKTTESRYMYRFTWALPEGAWLIDPRFDVVIRWEPWSRLLKIGAIPDRAHHSANFIDAPDITKWQDWNTNGVPLEPVYAYDRQGNPTPVKA